MSLTGAVLVFQVAALSSTEAEFIAGTDAAKVLPWKMMIDNNND